MERPNSLHLWQPPFAELIHHLVDVLFGNLRRSAINTALRFSVEIWIQFSLFLVILDGVRYLHRQTLSENMTHRVSIHFVGSLLVCLVERLLIKDIPSKGGFLFLFLLVFC